MEKRRIEGKFCESTLAPKRAFDKRSFRWKRSGRAWVLVGCPKGRFKRGVCKVGTRAHKLLKPSRGRCSTGAKAISKGREFGGVAPIPAERHCDLMRQGFMKMGLRKQRKPKALPKMITCHECQNWHRKGKHTASIEVRRANRAARIAKYGKSAKMFEE